ncbi:MAG: hypothetical protein PUA62_00355, partial [Lachnospiraceae bacterium]|nr:hypothetical protein [Lachnospiraceae bacterium]
MRKVILAKTAGFCFGVKRAVETVYEQVNHADKHTRVYTYGPIIHNEEVIMDLKNKGVYLIDDYRPDETTFAPVSDTGVTLKHHVVIRSHGVGKTVYQR